MSKNRTFLKTGVAAALESQRRSAEQLTLASVLKMSKPAQPSVPPPGTPTTTELMTPQPPAPEIARPKDAPATVAPLHEGEGAPSEAPAMQVEKTARKQPARPAVQRRSVLGMNAAELRRAMVFAEIIAPPKSKR